MHTQAYSARQLGYWKRAPVNTTRVDGSCNGNRSPAVMLTRTWPSGKVKDKDKDQTLKAKDQTYKDKDQEKEKEKDQTPKDKDKDQTFKAKDQDKD